jgi:hypothetical protein
MTGRRDGHERRATIPIRELVHIRRGGGLA